MPIEGIVTTDTRIRQLVEERQPQGIVMNRKLPAIVMPLILFMKALM